MKFKRYLPILILLYSILIVNLYGHYEVLERNFNSKSLALGESDISISGEIEAININPALGVRNITTLMFSYTYLFNIFHINNLIYGMRLKYFNINTSIVYLYLPKEDQIDYDNVLGTINLSKEFIKNLIIGVNIKYFYSKIIDYSADTFLFDFGLLYALLYSNHRLGIGVSIRNFGKWLKYKEEKIYIPINYRVGISYKNIKLERLILLISLDYTENETISYRFGVAYNIFQNMQLRIGYNVNENYNLFSAGAGYKIKKIFGKHTIYINYAIIPTDYLNYTNSFSVGFYF